MTAPRGFVDLASADELAAAGQLVVAHARHEILLFWNDGSPTALSNICIHRGRMLNEGVMLGNRLVCAGHQWSYDITTGYCAARERYQPRYEVEVRDDRIHVEFPPKRIGPT
jgi:nitrite reductase/ring-hydroxylating ferredoxin subunit